MIWSVFEYAATFVEYMIYADFMLKFLKPKKKQITLLCYLLILGINTLLTLTFNHFISYEGILGGLRIIINFLIALFLLKGSLFEKIFVPLSLDICALLISFMTLKSLGWILNETVVEMIQNRGLIRIIILFISKALLFVVTRAMLKLKGVNRYSFSFTECTAISIIFVITMLIGLGIFQMDINVGISSETPMTIWIGIGLIAINILTYILMKRISEKNIEKTELIIDKMQNELYRTQFKEAEKKYDEMNKIHHDMKNHLQCISSLLDDKEYEKAENYIADMIKNKLNFEFKQINTGNRVVDAISNAKLTQCIDENILTTVDAGSIEASIDDVDMCSLLGNIFDNAIEACRKVEKNKEIHFEINQKKGYINIIMKNSVQNSVIENNPKFKTTKKHKDIHGYGIKIVKSIVEKYNGMMELFEQDSFFIADIWISCGDFE